jgi:hypothetical protein
MAKKKEKIEEQDSSPVPGGLDSDSRAKECEIEWDATEQFGQAKTAKPFKYFMEGDNIVEISKTINPRLISTKFGQKAVIITEQGDEYLVSLRLLAKIGEYVRNGNRKLNIIRDGSGLNTRYIVRPIRE